MKKILSLLTLLLCVCSGAWADSEFVIFDGTGSTMPASTRQLDATTGFAYTCANFKTSFTVVSSYTNHGSYANAIRYGGGTTNSKNHVKLEIPQGYTATIDIVYGGTSTNTKWGVSTDGTKPNGSNCSKWNATATASTTLYTASIENLDGDEVYYIGGSGDGCVIAYLKVTLVADVLTAPLITTQPTSGTYIKNSSVTLEVAATPSAGNCSYQWFSTNADKSSETELTGETGETYTVDTSADTDTKYYYFCRVSDGGSSTTDTEVAIVRIVPDAGLSTWDVSSVTDDDISGNTDFWVVKSNDATVYHCVKAFNANERITLENKYGFDMVNGIKLYRTKGVSAGTASSAGGLVLFVGRGVKLAGNTTSHVEIPAEVGKYYRITHARGTNANTGFSISSGATYHSGDLTYEFTSNSERPTFVVKATATTIDLACTNDNTVLSKVEEIELDPEMNGVTPDGGSANGGSLVTFDGVGTIYYQWSESNTATIDSGEWTQGDNTTVPNVQGTRYLHVYAANSTTNTEIVTKTFVITKTANVLGAKQWDWTQTIDDTDIDNLTADSNWALASGSSTRWTSTSSVEWAAQNTFVTLQANDANIEWVEGLQFARSSQALKGDFIRLDNGQRFQFNGNHGLIKIPGLKAGDVVEVYFACSSSSASTRSITAHTNLKLTSAEGTNVSTMASDPKTAQFTVQADGDVVVENPDGAINFISIKVYELSRIEEATVQSYGWATYIPANNVSFEEETAYVVTDVNTSTGAVTVDNVTSVPAGTPVLLKGVGLKTMTVLAETPDAPAENMLSVSDGTDVDGKYPYVLAKNGESAGFKKWTGNVSVLNNRVVLWLDSAIAAAREFFSFDDEGETTGITSTALQPSTEQYYDLQGRRVALPTKGLYIVNGKKVIIK